MGKNYAELIEQYTKEAELCLSYENKINELITNITYDLRNLTNAQIIEKMKALKTEMIAAYQRYKKLKNKYLKIQNNEKAKFDEEHLFGTDEDCEEYINICEEIDQTETEAETVKRAYESNIEAIDEFNALFEEKEETLGNN